LKVWGISITVLVERRIFSNVEPDFLNEQVLK